MTKTNNYKNIGKPVGWRYDSVRHSLAAKGIKTGHRYDATITVKSSSSSLSSGGSKAASTAAKSSSSSGSYSSWTGASKATASQMSLSGKATTSTAKPAVSTTVKTVSTPTVSSVPTTSVKTTSSTPLVSTATGKVSSSVVSTAAKSADGYNAALGGYVKGGVLYPTNNPNWVPSAASAPVASVSTAASTAAKAVTSAPALNVTQAASALTNPATSTADALKILNQAAASNQLTQLNNALLQGNAGSAVGVTSQGGAVNILPSVISKPGDTGLSAVAIKVGAPGTTGISAQPPNFQSATGEMLYVGPNVPRSAAEIMADANIASGLSAKGILGATEQMAKSQAYTDLTLAASKDIATKAGQAFNADEAAYAITQQLGINPAAPKNATEARVVENLLKSVTGTTPAPQLPPVPQLPPESAPAILTPAITPGGAASFNAGPGGYVKSLGRLRFGMGARERTLADYYRERYGVGYDVEGGLGAGGKVALGAAAVGGGVALGASQGNKSANRAVQASAYAARKGLKPWQR